ncbi:peptidase C15, pyroglutamyl peptidase I-like protein [Fistulina hepatica ATCC 64428]|uniref:Peptidase C15, pyroglutamyl peptidase I-like protein n=1 Tax=Fistulina hepatica ATCC 64428 TaxID=1128425 RepID=A0A0D7AMK4_9AGAR|nr:peptidase C15, pyroglutamyl peptidase I-like protein [Fistulina hepatica ATCC 64428]
MPSLQQPHRVLLTGFGPFRQYKQNPSWLAAQQLHDTELHTPRGSPIHVSAFDVPVVYSTVLDMVPGLHVAPPKLPADVSANFPMPPATGYTLIVHVGVGRAQPLRIEVFGDKDHYPEADHHREYAPIIDNSSNPPLRGFVSARYMQSPNKLRIKLNIEELVHKCAEDGLHTVISEDAGHYLCDFIFYCSLAESELAKRGTPVMFVHCPPLDLPATAVIPPHTPRTAEAIADGLGTIIRRACEMIEKM